MNFVKNVFGKSKKPAESSSVTNTIQRLLAMEELLNKKQAYLEGKIEKELKIIKEHGTANKRFSLQALKRKKKHEAELTKIDGQLTQIEFQRNALETGQTNMEVFKIMDASGKALKAIHMDIDRDKVEDAMDELREQQEIAGEISEAISRPVADQDEDEEELLKELEALELEDMEKKLLDTEPIINLPEVPTHEVRLPAQKAKEKITKDDKELAELQQWAS